MTKLFLSVTTTLWATFSWWRYELQKLNTVINREIQNILFSIIATPLLIPIILTNAVSRISLQHALSTACKSYKSEFLRQFKIYTRSDFTLSYVPILDERIDKMVEYAQSTDNSILLFEYTALKPVGVVLILANLLCECLVWVGYLPLSAAACDCCWGQCFVCVCM